MNQHNRTKDRQVRGFTPTQGRETCQMPGTDMAGRDLNPTFLEEGEWAEIVRDLVNESR